MIDRDSLLIAISASAEARALLARGAPEAARLAARRALDALPSHLDALNVWAEAARALGDRGDERAALTALVAAADFLAAPHNDLGRMDLEAGNARGALAHFGAALARDPGRGPVWHNHARALMAADEPEGAGASLAKALALDPAAPSAWSDLIAACREAGLWDAATRAAARALALAPGLASALWNRALVRLQTGDMVAGFADYEARWRDGPFVGGLRHADRPTWDGRLHPGLRLLVWAEQGLGDTIQFARYVPILAARGVEVILEAPSALVALLGTLAGPARVIAQGAPPPPCDAVVALGSLPHRLELGAVGADAYLRADGARVARWRSWLASTAPDGATLRIGIVWQGNPQGSIDRGRSVPLAAFAPLALTPGVDLIVLQKRHGLDQIETCGFGARLRRPPPEFDEGPDAFADSAALMESLDLIVSSDTAIAHLAGALGRPVWVPLKRVPDWRWLMAGATTPWYPTMRLFRQRRRGDWAAVMAEIADAARRLAPSADPPSREV